MRRRFSITGVSECAWVCACSKFMFDGDAERTDDFCCYLCCFPCAVWGGSSRTMTETQMETELTSRTPRRRPRTCDTYPARGLCIREN
jgi:hypothetical protein